MLTVGVQLAPGYVQVLQLDVDVAVVVDLHDDPLSVRLRCETSFVGHDSLVDWLRYEVCGQ